MQFVVHYSISPEHRDAAQSRFKETGGPPPEGVKMIARWHCVHGGEGFVHCEADDAAAMATWVQEWSDVLTFRVMPVVDDQTMVKIMGG